MARMKQILGEEQTKKQNTQYILFFLNDDQEQSVDIVETGRPDFSKVIEHVAKGGSVFISSRRKPKLAYSNMSFAY